jgi:uncharacterized protein YggT (Ycf19 family)
MSTSAIVGLVFQTLWWVILGRVLLSWFDPSGNYRISRILPTFGGVDWSPLVTMIVLNLLENFILRSLAG